MSTDLQKLLEEVNAPPANPDFRSGYIAVVGKPNVGKSTLVNALVGRKVSIVSPKAQTTRRRVLGILTTAEAQVLFMDTPGVHQPKQELGKFMMRQVENALQDCDMLVFVADVRSAPDDADRRVAERIQPLRQPKLWVLNKADAADPRTLIDTVKAYEELFGAALPSPLATQAPSERTVVMTSAVRGDGLDDLLRMIVARLPLGPAFYPSEQYTDQTDRVVAAELIREQALRYLEQEVPHAVAVSIDEFKERRRAADYIGATIFVERESQKGILIGRGGEMLKKIGSEARKQIERDLGKPVFLELWVKVREGWRKDARAVESLLGQT